MLFCRCVIPAIAVGCSADFHVLSVSCVAVLGEFDNLFQIFHGGIVQFPRRFVVLSWV